MVGILSESKQLTWASLRFNIQGLAQITPLFYYKIISMSFCNITISHSSAPQDILGEMFK